MNRYEDYPQIWAPTHYPSLFVVKVPEAIATLEEKSYRNLMVERVSWMIQQWVSYTSLQDTQKLLATTLSELHPSQDYPLIDPDEETFSEMIWRQEWGETFILHNHRFSEALWLMGMDETGFPVNPFNSSHPEFDRLTEVHQETDLETWLSELTPSNWD